MNWTSVTVFLICWFVLSLLVVPVVGILLHYDDEPREPPERS